MLGEVDLPHPSFAELFMYQEPVGDHGSDEGPRSAADERGPVDRAESVVVAIRPAALRTDLVVVHRAGKNTGVGRAGERPVNLASRRARGTSGNPEAQSATP